MRLAEPDRPINPYSIPGDTTDTPSVHPRSWERDPQSGVWRREVVHQSHDHGIQMATTETADADKAAQLDAFAQTVIARNAARGSAAIASHYQQTHEQQGWAQHGQVPEAVAWARTHTDQVLASDGRTYQRGGDGEWTHDGMLWDSKAEGNLRDELNATYWQIQTHYVQRPELSADIAEHSRWHEDTKAPKSQDGVGEARQSNPPQPAQDGIDPSIQQQWLQQRQQQQLQQFQREEQRHTSAIHAASEQKEAAQAVFGSGLRLSDPEHPAYENYEQARRAVVEMYSHQRKDVDERIEPMAASMVAQAQRDGLTHINDVKPSPDGQQLIASNTREANAAHRETAQLPMAQAANQSVEESSRQWATHQIAQAQERIQEHTQARANVQERMQAQTQEFARAQTATPERAPVTAYTQAAQPQVAAPAMTAGIEAPMPQPTPQAQERAPIQTFAPAVEPQVTAPNLSAEIDTRMPPQAPQMQPQPYVPTPEQAPTHTQAPSHTFAPAPEPQVAVPAMTADSDMQVQIQLAAQQAQQLAQQMLLQQQQIAELERQLQDRRSQEERRDAERRDDQYREAHQPDAQQRHDDPLQKEAAAGHDLDPRHPRHPDHTLYKGIRGKVVDLLDAHGVACNDEQLECVTARIARDARKANLSDVAYLTPSHDAQDRPDLSKGIWAVEHQDIDVHTRFSKSPALQQAMRTPLEESYQELDKFTQQNLEQQRQNQLERDHGIHGPGMGPGMGR